MERIDALKARYARYEETVRQLRKNAPPFAGFWGWGDDPRNDPCHTQFYEDVGVMMEALLSSCPEEAVAYQAARWLLAAPAECGQKDAAWFQYAAQGHCRELIPLLTPAHCAELARLMDETTPRRERLPVQTKIYKQLTRAAGSNREERKWK